MILRPSLFAAAALLFLVTGVGRAQYVEDSIEVPGGWVGTMTYNSRADVVYGTCEMANGVFAIYCPTNIMFRNLPANDARCVVYDSIDNKAYVSCGFDGTESLKVIDGQNHIIIGRFSVPGANQLVWEPTRNRLYVTCSSESSVAVVDCAHDSVIAQIDVGTVPIKLHLNSRRGKLYVQNYDDGSVSIIDLATNLVIRSIQVGGNPDAGYYAADVDKYYSPNESNDAIAVIDGLSDSIIAMLPFMANGYVHAIGGSDASNLVLAEAYNGTAVLYAIDTRADTLYSTIDVSGSVWSIVCSPTTGFLYCAGTGADSVLVVDPVGALVTCRLSVGAAPFSLLPAPSHGRMYVGCLNVNKVYVIRDSSNGVAESDGLERLTLLRVIASPNPFTTRTSLTLASVDTLASAVVICNSYGREVRRLELARHTPRAFGMVWDGTDQAGSPLPAGIYVARVVGRPEVGTKLVRVLR